MNEPPKCPVELSKNWRVLSPPPSLLPTEVEPPFPPSTLITTFNGGFGSSGPSPTGAANKKTICPLRKKMVAVKKWNRCKLSPLQRIIITEICIRTNANKINFMISSWTAKFVSIGNERNAY